jgi:hypothetical protein
MNAVLVRHGMWCLVYRVDCASHHPSHAVSTLDIEAFPTYLSRSSQMPRTPPLSPCAP